MIAAFILAVCVMFMTVTLVFVLLDALDKHH